MPDNDPWGDNSEATEIDIYTYKDIKLSDEVK